MQGFPHHYPVNAYGSSQGNITVGGSGLPGIDTQAPPQFGGPEGIWSPETMLVGSVANCFILTFRAIARASKVEWISIDCKVEGVLDRVDGVTQFTEFNINAALKIPADSKVERVQRLLEKAEKLCLITASLKSKTSLNTDIQIS